MSVEDLVARVRAGEPRAVARAISIVEDAHEAAPALLATLHADGQRARIVGITGPPGAGKSTLVDALTAHLRSQGRTVGILAVDPSSPYTGGALLGDRIRLHRHALDPRVFVRSMATRGHLGGLARGTADAARILGAAGCSPVLVETVGVGQDEVDIVRTADVSVVVLVPGTGDDVQALKAGVMEIADVFVVNKADREGADRLAASIDAMLALTGDAPGTWRPPIVKTTATTGEGIADVWDAVERFLAHAAATTAARRQMRAEHQLRVLLGDRLIARVTAQQTATGARALADLAAEVAAGGRDPYTAIDELVARAFGTGDASVPDGPTVDHVAVAVHDMAAAEAFFCGVLGLARSEAETVEAQGVRVCFVGGPGARVELLTPLSAETPVGRFLDKRGPGLHHVALAVADLDGLLASLAARGVRLIDTTPRAGAGGTRIAFVHPASTGGVLVEFKERK